MVATEVIQSLLAGSDADSLLQERVEPKLKVIFAVGGGGSGKGFIVKHTALGLGFRVVNSDDAFEFLLQRSGMGLDMTKHTPEQVTVRDVIRGRAKEITHQRKELYKKSEVGIVIDGTGKDYAEVKEQKHEFEEAGYDTFMIFVNTRLSRSLAQNAKRERKVPEEIIRKAWHATQDNIGKFAALFKGNFMIIDNNRPMTTNDPVLVKAFRVLSAWAEKPAPKQMMRDLEKVDHSEEDPLDEIDAEEFEHSDDEPESEPLDDVIDPAPEEEEEEEPGSDLVSRILGRAA